ncbi:hypothetical protein JD499_15685 [Aeromonas enteropelogenes]|uniref:hypothetical protein n=1 Tax=Aeromonas enteropelogenes TaxID=29489 RepID=UPI0019202F5E|nr:hypothetical protein [Aeromonas enteropelogenes]MBL0458624.1 hypothetical protein [Aeromonas enteropelogenes]
MARGYYEGLINNEHYQNTWKDWLVEVQYSKICWFDLLINNHEQVNTRKLIVDELVALKKEVESNLEKRFVYFICSRKRIRFNPKKKVKYGFFDGSIKIQLLIGKDKKPRNIKFYIVSNETQEIITPKVELDERFITIHDAGDNQHVFFVHDFLQTFNINLNFTSDVHYVGYTKNPESRPTNGSHAGLTETLCNLSMDDNDLLIYFNLFKVIARTDEMARGVTMVIPNSMTDEIDVDTEGRIIEKCFIEYFNSRSQNKNRTKEHDELRKNIFKLKYDHRIRSLQFYYEIDGDCDYFTLGSSSISPSRCHMFTIVSDENDFKVKTGSDIYENLFGTI